MALETGVTVFGLSESSSESEESEPDDDPVDDPLGLPGVFPNFLSSEDFSQGTRGSVRAITNHKRIR